MPGANRHPGAAARAEGRGVGKGGQTRAPAHKYAHFSMGGIVVDAALGRPWNSAKIRVPRVGAPTLGASTVESETLLREIAGYCRRVGMAESTFGRLAVNDGKLVSRLRFGGRVTLNTVERVQSFIEHHQPSARRRRLHGANRNGHCTAPGALVRK